MSTATFKVNPITVPPLECPKVILPTKADLVNMFSQLANLPAQLIAAGQEEVAKQIQDILDEVRSLLSIYDPKFDGLSIPEIEWEIMITRLVQDYPMYVQQKILELISKLVPIDFVIPVLGLKIDILKIFTAEGVDDIKKQLSVYRGELIEIAEVNQDRFDRLAVSKGVLDGTMVELEKQHDIMNGRRAITGEHLDF